jgi:hypothetical protein
MESQFDQITKVLAQATSRRQALRGIGSGLIGGVLATLGARKAWAANDQVTICHVPPGNPNNVHTITVSTNAVPAHLRHGDAVCAPGNEDCCFNSGTSTAVCTNLETDATNCGGCGITCGENEVCNEGSCVPKEACPVATVCGGFVPCGDDPQCLCVATYGGGNQCFRDTFNGSAGTCETNDNCPEGQACFNLPGCAGDHFCIVLCSTPTLAGAISPEERRGLRPSGR